MARRTAAQGLVKDQRHACRQRPGVLVAVADAARRAQGFTPCQRGRAGQACAVLVAAGRGGAGAQALRQRLRHAGVRGRGRLPVVSRLADIGPLGAAVVARHDGA